MKRMIAMLLAGVMIFTNVGPALGDGAIVHAEEIDVAGTVEVVTGSDYYINPLYADVINKDDLVESSSAYGTAAVSEPEYVTDETVIIDTIRTAMTERTASFTINYEHTYTDAADSEAIKTAVLADMEKWALLAMEDTGATPPNQGDYLKYHLAGYEYGHSGSIWSSGLYQGTLTYTFTYHTTNAQEQTVNTKVDKIIADKIDDSMSDYEKIKAIYDYLCTNVSYDYNNLNDKAYTLKYSAYAALIDGTAVCQGYATALYRLLEEAGVDTRVITGIGDGGSHAWNIIKLGDYYYCADATWDTNYASTGNYQYFLKCTANFKDHTSDTEYTTETFEANYPISPVDYEADSGEGESGGSGETGDSDDNTTEEEEYVSEDGLSGTSGTIAWTLDKETGVFTVSGSGPMKDYASSGTPWYEKRDLIKSIQIGDGITHVGDYAFSYSTQAVEVHLADTVTSIGDHAFSANYELASLEMPAVKSIGDNAFSNCNSLTMFTWPEQLEEIGEYAFYRCEVLRDIEFSDCLVSIGKNAFEQCWSITDVTLPDTLTEIGDYAFDSCSSLETVSLPDHLTSLSDFIFRGCSSLTQVDLPEDLTVINSYAFADCVNLVWLWIPDGVEEIGSSAFEACTRIERILIPGSVDTIGYGAFYHCLNLKSGCYFGSEEEWKDVSVAGYNEPLLDADMEFDSNTYTSYEIAKEVGCVESGVLTYASADGISRTESMQALGHSYVEGSDSTQWICEECGHEVTTESGTLGYGSCGPNLTWHLSADGVMTISGEGTMINVGVRTRAPWYDLRESVLQAVVEEGVTYLGEQAFSYCDEMTKVSLPDSMTEIGAEAFFACSKLNEIDLPNNLIKIGNSVFQSCTFSEISLPNTLTTIGEYAFYRCESLANLVFPNNLKTIGQWAFAYCDGLEEITLPENLEVLGDYAFDSCKGLKKVSLPDNLTTLGMYAFRGCDLLEAVNIPTGITEIAQNTFDGCTSLSSIALPKNITSVGSSAFYNCSKLTDVLIYSYKCVINNSAFTNCSENLVIHGIKDSVVQTYAQNNDIQFEILQVDCGDDHEWKEEYTIDVEPTCTVDGAKSYHCYICDEINEESVVSIPASHSIEKVAAVEATCISEGNIVYYECTECGKYFSDKTGTKEIELASTIVAMKEHSYTNYVSDNNASCTEDGTKTAKCDYGCGTEDTVIDGGSMLEHDYGDWNEIKASTCMDSGTKERQCNNCGVIEQEEVAAVSHKYTVYENDGNATCTSDGTKTASCDYGCGTKDTVSEENSALGHDWSGSWELSKAATCIEKGELRKVCVRCDYYITDTIETIDHCWDTGEITTTPTCITKEVKTYTCTECSNTKEEVGEYGDHIMGAWKVVTNPTYAKEGLESRACTLCEYSESQTVAIEVAESISLNISSYTIPCGETITLIATCTPIAPSAGDIEWTSSNDAVATVDANGKVTAVGDGTATITAEVSEVTAVCEVTVITAYEPSAPTTVKAVLSGGYDDVKVTWSAAEYATGYDVYYKLSTASSYTFYKSVTATSCTITNLADNVTYNFKVVPYYSDGTDKYQDENAYKTANVMTKKNISAPKTFKAVLYGYDDVKLTWTKSSGASGYVVYYKLSTASTYKKLTTTTKLTCNATNLSDGVQYTFKIVPYYLNGKTKVEGYYSKSVNIYTLKKLATPTVTKASSTKITIKWQNISGESGYQLSKSTSKTGTSIVATTTGTSKTLTVTRNKGYYYKVRAYKTVSGTKIYGPWSSVTSYNLRYVAAQGTVTAALYGYDDVKLSWKKVTGANYYDVYYKKSSDSSYTKLGSTTGTSYKKANLSDGVKYTFKVVPTYKSSGKILAQGSAKTVSITTLKQLNTPTVTKSSSTKVKVAWNNIGGETGYQISQSTSKTGTKIVSTYATTSGKSKTITATRGKTYYYKVRAYKTVGSKKIYGPWSAVTAYKLK